MKRQSVKGFQGSENTLYGTLNAEYISLKKLYTTPIIELYFNTF